MLHLLTENQKHKVIREYRMRLSIIVCGAIVLSSVTGFILLLPSYLSAIGKVDSIRRNNKEKEDSISNLSAQNFDDKIKNVDSNLAALKMTINIISPRDVYSKITSALPNGVSIIKYSYSLVDTDNAVIDIDGVSKDRESLVTFQNNLKTNPEFSGVEIPLDSFAKKSNLSFTIKFNLIKSTKK